MAIGTTNIGATPCCGVIQRTWECLPDAKSETGSTHTPGAYNFGSGTTLQRGPYVPTFTYEQGQLNLGICPDCEQSFVAWLRANGGRETESGWRWDYSAAGWAYTAGGIR